MDLESCLADGFRRIRDEQELSLDGMATILRERGALAWSKYDVANIVHGRKTLKFSEALAVCVAFHVTLADLISTDVEVVRLAGHLQVPVDALRKKLNFQVHDLPFNSAGGQASGVRVISKDQIRASPVNKDLRRLREVQTRVWDFFPSDAVLEWSDERLDRLDKATEEIDLASQGNAEITIARRVGVSPATIAIAAFYLWGHGYTEERDIRARELAKTSEFNQRSLRRIVSQDLVREAILPLLSEKGLLHPNNGEVGKGAPLGRGGRQAGGRPRSIKHGKRKKQ